MNISTQVLALAVYLVAKRLSNLVDRLLPFASPFQVIRQDLEHPLINMVRVSSAVRRDNDILVTPKFRVRGQRLRVCHVERGTSDLLRVQRRDEIFGVDNRPPSGVADVCLLLAQQRKLFLGDHVSRLLRKRKQDDQKVKIRGQEVVDLVFAVEPPAGEQTIGVAKASLDEAIVLP